MIQEEFLKRRGAAACLSAAYDCFSQRLGAIVRRIWLPLLIVALACAAGIHAYTTLLACSDQELLGATVPYAEFCCAYLAAFVGCIWLFARFMTLFNGQSTRFNLRRTLALFAVWFVVYLVFITLIAVGAASLESFSTTTQAPSSTVTAVCILLALVALVLSFVVFLPLVYVFGKYYLDAEVHLPRNLWSLFKTGMRHFGFLFGTELLAMLIAYLVCLLVSVPFLILFSANLTSIVGTVQGDPSGLPGYIPWLLFVVSALTVFVGLVVWLWNTIVILYACGSIDARQMSRDEALNNLPSE